MSSTNGTDPQPAVRQLTPIDTSSSRATATASPTSTSASAPPAAAAASDPGAATVDDEAIARLLQAEFDEEARQLAAQLAAQHHPRSPTTDNGPHSDAGYPGSAYYQGEGATTERRNSQSFAGSISEARDVVRTKLTDLISYIKTEAARAGQASTPTSPTSANAALERAHNMPSTPVTPGGASAATLPPSFDFAKFLDQMRDRRALPLTKYFRSFLREFTKRKWTVNEQVKIVHDFLDFMGVQLAKNDMFVGATDQEMENAKEGMEKLLMNKLHQYTFSPSTSDDGVKDEVLYKKISILQWIELKHLDIHVDAELAGPFLRVAQKELLKMNDYKAPRDKLICILNACKLIFGLLKQSNAPETADSFLPLLIYTVLQANPPHLHSNMQYMQRFRNPAKLQSEAGYYLTNLMGAVSFIESLDHTSLSIAKQDFDAHIEARMRELEESEAQRRADRALAALDGASPTAGRGPRGAAATPTAPAGDLISSQQLEQLAANVKKPIEVVSRWFAQATQALVSPDSSVPPTPTTPAGPAAPGTPHDGGGVAGLVTEMQAVDLSHLSAEERLLMSDYELQLAMAMSISLEEERMQWEKVPENDPLAEGKAQGSSPKSPATKDLIDLAAGDDGAEQFSLEASARKADEEEAAARAAAAAGTQPEDAGKPKVTADTLLL